MGTKPLDPRPINYTIIILLIILLVLYIIGIPILGIIVFGQKYLLSNIDFIIYHIIFSIMLVLLVIIKSDIIRLMANQRSF
jgi:hypothetical protein